MAAKGRKAKQDLPSDTRSRNERYDDHLAEYELRNSAGHVLATRDFSARIVRKGDRAEHVRGCELVRKGEVVELPIDRDANGEQGAGVVAWLRADGYFEPTEDALTDAPLDDPHHGTMTSREAEAERVKHIEPRKGQVLTITRGELESIVGAAVATALAAKPAPAPKTPAPAPAAA